jgi:ribonuclease P/MRP protein subunit RPP40
LEDNHLMNDNQHGFRPGRSCLTQLIEHYDHILYHLEKGSNVDVIYLDFAKAFDKVDLCHKLRTMGIGGNLGLWLHNFLHGRMQKVLVGGTPSSATAVKSGVPQGTVLGPILFLLHIADINNGTTSHVSSFADDTRVLRPILNENDVESLQSNLRTIYEWQSLNNMEFNDKKFESLRYGKNQHIKSVTSYTTPSDTPIEVKHSVKDLGIFMSDDCSFKPHITSLCIKIRNLTGWVLRTFITRDRFTMKILWSSLIQPHIDYCSQLWAPHKFGDLSLVENLQRTFTSHVNGMLGLNYWERLLALGWFSVERRFERYRVLYTWKALENMVPNFGVNVYATPRHGRLCRIPPINTKAPQFAITLTEGSLRVRGPRLFNCLPAEVRALSGCPLDSFKRHLDIFLHSVPDRPRLLGYEGCSPDSSNSLQNAGLAGAQR